MQSSGNDAARPHKRKTERVAPMVEIRITFVTCILSTRLPRRTWPNTEVALKSITVIVPAREDRPIDRAYVGSQMFGMKNPRLSRILPA